MPIPFILIGIGAASGVLGAGKNIKAAIDNKKAKDITEDAKSIVERSTDAAATSRKNADTALSSLGAKKISILKDSMSRFLSAYESLHSIELGESIGLNEIASASFNAHISELKQMSSTAASVAVGIAGGTAAGALVAIGAYGGAMTFGTCATTGTAIATLSGITASNATLAFLGGGALSVGGLGMAGGTTVLGGLAAGPALAVMGFIIGAKASKNKEQALSNLHMAKQYEEEVKTIRVQCKAIRMRANMFYRLLIKLDAVFSSSILALERTMAEKGTDYSKYGAEDKAVVGACLSLAKAVKTVLDTPILTKDGIVSEESEAIAKQWMMNGESAFNALADSQPSKANKNVSAKMTPIDECLAKDIEKCRIAADRGDSDSQRLLGLYDAVEKGNVRAHIFLANCYMFGKGVVTDYKKAIGLLRIAVEKDSSPENHHLYAMSLYAQYAGPGFEIYDGHFTDDIDCLMIPIIKEYPKNPNRNSERGKELMNLASFAETDLGREMLSHLESAASNDYLPSQRSLFTLMDRPKWIK